MVTIVFHTFSLIFCFYFSVVQACNPAREPSEITVLDVHYIPNNIQYADPVSTPNTSPSLVSTAEFEGIGEIAFDSSTTDTYYLICDRGSVPRFYTAKIQVINKGDRLGFGTLAISDVQNLRDSSNPAVVLEANKLIPKGIALNPNTPDRFYWSNEQANGAIVGLVDENNPSIHESVLSTGALVQTFTLPDAYLRANPDLGARGVPDSRGLEALTANTDGTKLYTATQIPLLQDTPVTEETVGRARILELDIQSGSATAEYLYNLGPVPAGQNILSLFSILWLDDDTWLSLETAQVEPGSSSSVRIQVFLVNRNKATNTLSSTLANPESPLPDSATALEKKLVFQLDEGDLPGGNDLLRITGMTLGPKIDGVQTLILVADNNRASIGGGIEDTQFLLTEFKN